MVYRIGLTGGIGCGKSVVGTALQELGAEYVDTDRLVHELLQVGSPTVDQVRARFGPDVMAEDGSVDRRKLGEIVFNDSAALRDLEAILHSSVRTKLRRRIAETSAPVIVVDAIKLIEGGLHRDVDSVWVVTCDPLEQRHRLIDLRGMTAEDADARIASQPAQESRLEHASVVIENRGTLEDTRRQVANAWAQTVAANIRA